MSASAVLSVAGLRLSRAGREVLKGVDLSVAKGEVVAVADRAVGGIEQLHRRAGDAGLAEVLQPVAVQVVPDAALDHEFLVADDEGIAAADDLAAIQKRVRAEVDAATDEAERAPMPRGEDALGGLFA